MPDKHQLLHRYWGYDAFRPLQEEIVDAVVQGLDVLALLPTGGGKSLCYQLPALLREGVCLVVSPLVALMKDQVQQLNNRGLKAACIVAGMGADESTATLYNAISGQLKYLYVSPERLRQRRFIEHLRRMKVGLIAVDEAHCVSQWGYDFRPPYLQIAEVRTYHPSVPLIALTATATREVEEDICLRLKMPHCRRFRASFERPNLTYRVRYGGDKTSYLVSLLLRDEGSTIVYVRNRRLTQSIADMLCAQGISAACYHAGLSSEERDLRQSLWMHDKCRVMVATNAFGMGIDKPDVRRVVHLEPPEALESYFQEAGRAGRDGMPADAVLLYDSADDALLERNIDIDFPSIQEIRNVYRALCNFYKLPMGSGTDAQYDFDLQEVCGTYNFDVRRFYSACRFLEREGLISLPDREDAYSSLYITLGHDELYRFQVEHMAMGNLLQVLARMYSGLFSGPTPIDERKVASRSLMDESEVVRLLMQMKALHVVDYRPRPSKPQIIFPMARINERDITFGTSDFQQLYDAARHRLDAVLRYVHNRDECRSRQLLAYFGEIAAADCGRCDVCRYSKPKPDLEEAVCRLLRNTRMDIKTLASELEDEGYNNVQETVRQMLDEGILYLDSNLSLSVR